MIFIQCFYKISAEIHYSYFKLEIANLCFFDRTGLFQHSLTGHTHTHTHTHTSLKQIFWIIQDFKRPGKFPLKEKISIEMISDELNLCAGSQHQIHSAELLKMKEPNFMCYICYSPVTCK